MKKNERIEALVAGMKPEGPEELHPCYTGYFLCFNRMEYYEAHDVLEHLWLKTRTREAAYYKGLIQVAGAFVHLKQQYLRPHHHKYGRRLAPAVRLLRIARANLEAFRPRYLFLDVDALTALCAEVGSEIERSHHRINPWRPERAPQLVLDAAGSG